MKWGKFGSFFACSTYNKKDPNSCTFTKENFAAKPEMNTQEGQDAEQTEEYCEACGRVMVLKRGRFGAFMACPGYSEDPPCKTTRKLTQKQQQKAPQPLDEKCPKCGEQLVLRNGQYGEFVSCSGYPKCKYIKQNLIEGMKCPKCGDGDIAERKARRGNLFYGCTNYPKCDFTSNAKPVAGEMSGMRQSLPAGEDAVRRGLPGVSQQPQVSRGGRSAEEAGQEGRGSEEPPEQVVCTYSRKIAEPQMESIEAMRYQTKAEALPVA